MNHSKKKKEIMANGITILFIAFTLYFNVVNSNKCLPQEIIIQRQVNSFDIVFRGLAVYTNPPNVSYAQWPFSFKYFAHFWLINVYKGSEYIAQHLDIQVNDEYTLNNIRDRKVNVSKFNRPERNSDDWTCWKLISPQKYYIVFANIRNNQLIASTEKENSTVIDWTEQNEKLIWDAMGWSEWSDWSACSKTCEGGQQERTRFCKQDTCLGYNKEIRNCNTFRCKGTIEPLSLENEPYFHPAAMYWERVPNRKTAWRIKPSYYLWLPASHVSFAVADFHKHFTLMVSIRVNPMAGSTEGTIFSLRSRREENTFLSLNLSGPDIIQLIHSTPNGKQSVVIPAVIADGHWHQLALGIEDNVSVRSYLDCQWISTDILRSNTFETTDDPDLLIGYMFTGDLEHLILVPDAAAVVQQCSTKTTAVTDYENVDEGKEDDNSLDNSKADWKYRTPFERVPIIKQRLIDNFDDDEDNYEDSEIDGSGFGSISEVKWTKWSNCSSSCGEGIQTRNQICYNPNGKITNCEEELKETRLCYQRKCKFRKLKRKIKHVNKKNEQDNKYSLKSEGKCNCQNGGNCTTSTSNCTCNAGFTGKLCEKQVECNPPCLNQGICIAPSVCQCPDTFTGATCETQICKLGCMLGEDCKTVKRCDCSNYEDRPEYICKNSILCTPCKNGGTCFQNSCKCLPGWSGDDCSIETCKGNCENCKNCFKNASTIYDTYSCDPPCQDEAICASGGTCLCDENNTDTRCQEIRCNYIPVEEPYTVGIRRPAKRKDGIQCNMNNAICGRLVPKYQTIYKTLYRTVYKCKEP